MPSDNNESDSAEDNEESRADSGAEVDDESTQKRRKIELNLGGDSNPNL